MHPDFADRFKCQSFLLYDINGINRVAFEAWYNFAISPPQHFNAFKSNKSNSTIWNKA